MARRKGSALWDEPDEPQTDDGDDTWETSDRRPTGSSNAEDGDWQEAGGSEWLDDPLDDLEGEIQGCEEGEVYRLLGRPGRRGGD